MACYEQTAPILCSVKSGFTTLVNKWASRINSISCVLLWHALVSKAFQEYLKTVLKHVTERVNFIKARACVLKSFIKMYWWIFNVEQCFIPNSYLATVTFLNFGVVWAKSFQCCRSTHLKLLYLFKILVWGRVLLNENYKTKHWSQRWHENISFNYCSQNLR